MLLDRQRIADLLPYGKTFLFVENATVNCGKSTIETTYSYKPDHPILSSHFVGGPFVVPGVILTEQLCQSALLLGMANGSITSPQRAYLGRIKCHFISPALAPCTIRAQVRFDREANGVVMFSGIAFNEITEILRLEALSSTKIHEG